MRGLARGKIEAIVAGTSEDEKGKVEGIGESRRTEVVRGGIRVSREMTRCSSEEVD